MTDRCLPGLIDRHILFKGTYYINLYIYVVCADTCDTHGLTDMAKECARIIPDILLNHGGMNYDELFYSLSQACRISHNDMLDALGELLDASIIEMVLDEL